MKYHTPILIGLLMGVSGCATDHHADNIACAQRPGCVSSFGDTGYGPVHAQAVAPDSPGVTPPFR